MALKKVYCFDLVHSLYGVLNYFIDELCKALNRQGVEARIIPFDKTNPEIFLDTLIKDRPDCTLCFNGLLPDDKGQFLCDLIKVPHVAYLVDAPYYFFPMVKSKYSVLASIDEDFSSIWRSYKFYNEIFLPHAVSRDLRPLETPEWLYDVVMLSSFIDHESLLKEWPNKYGPLVTQLLEEAAERVLSDSTVSCMQAFIDTMNVYIKKGINPRQIDLVSLLIDLESYVTGKNQIELLQSIEGAPIHIFGAHEKSNWKTLLGKQGKHVHVHPKVSFMEALEIMKRSKIVLHPTLKMKHGLHERVLSALACGAAVVAPDTPFLKDSFQDDKEILLYKPRDWIQINDKIHRCLQDEGFRATLASRGREIVMHNHTWDQRAMTLKEKLPPILQKLT